MFLPHPRVKVSIVGSLRDREAACSASDRQGSNFESCVWRTVSSQSSHHPQEVLLAQFSLYVHKGGLKPDSFYLSPYNLLSLYYILTLILFLTTNVLPFLYHLYIILLIDPGIYKTYSQPNYLSEAHLKGGGVVRSPPRKKKVGVFS